MAKVVAEDKVNYIPMVDRAIDIIELFYEQGNSLGVSEIAARLSLPKANVYRILATMEKRGYIIQDGKTDKYVLGHSFIKIGEFVRGKVRINDIALPFMEKLADETGETAYLCKLFNNEALVINVVNGEPSSLNSMVTPSIPLYCSALGRCLMVDFSDRQIDQYIKENGLQKRTIRTVDAKDSLLEEIAKINEEGVGIETEEYEYGMMCIAGPIRDRQGKVIASMSVSGPTSRIQHKGEEGIIAKVKAACEAIQNTISF